MGELGHLDRAAAVLHDVLTDEEVGACVPGLPDGESLRVGELGVDRIQTDVTAAIEYAGREGATLVLALLGHGFVPGDSSGLHFMGADSADGNTLTAVNVPLLFLEAADRLGVDGVLGIVDTCSAAGAIPLSERLLGGLRSGRTRLGLLMASAAHDSAFEFRLAFGVTRLLERGVIEARQTLDVSTICAELRNTEAGSGVVKLDYDGDSFAADMLWLARNRGCSLSSAPAVAGRPGRTALAKVLEPLGAEYANALDHTPERLRTLREALAHEPFRPATVRAAQIVDTLLVAARTSTFLHSEMSEALDTTRLRRAVALAAPMPIRVAGTDDVADVVERVALSHPVVDGSCRPRLAQFVMALSALSDRPVADQALVAWAKSIDAVKHVNDAKIWAHRLRQAKRLRLVVSLHSSTTGHWPDVLETWLLVDGELDSRGRLPCTADRAGVELAISAAVDEAEERADALDLPLTRVDVAMPARLLLSWHPEKVNRGECLGVNFDLVMRWSERLNPPSGLRWTTRAARRRLANINACVDGAPVDWLTEHDVRDLGLLRDKLAGGAYERAIGLDRHPNEDERLMSTLLAYVPVLLWPAGEDVPAAGSRNCLDENWERMPGEVLRAYRRKWSEQPVDALADFRVVWDDEEWLDFCKVYQRGIRS